MTRLLLLRAAATAETRRAGFPGTAGDRPVAGCAPLDRAGAAAAAALAAVLPPLDAVWASWARRAQQTAALAVPGATPTAMALLAGADMGRWRGRGLADLAAAEPEALAAWHADPAFAGHGGESRAALRDRAAALLARAAADGGTVLAVTAGDLVRSAVALVLDAGDAAFWAVDVPPASVTELTAGGGRWRVARTAWSPALRGAAAAVPADVAEVADAAAAGSR